MLFEEACAAAATAPGQFLASAWEVVRVSALQLSRSLYDDRLAWQARDVVTKQSGC
ncbi:hypothetical protein [Streptomyces sp. NPDC047803]|uniref:hypothetical protein n=1 Tax=unclassified Streptomyces TaxID=2593676 RepID=UPI0033FBE80C